MLGFLSKENDNLSCVKNEEIHFVHIDDKLSRAEIQLEFSKLAFDFANKFDIDKVYLHFGKDTILYDYTI